MYRCKTEYFQKMEKTFISLEEEIIPILVGDKKALASIFDETYHDYGTYDRYQKLLVTICRNIDYCHLCKMSLTTNKRGLITF